ncbi:MAG: putative transposase DNA-binding domain protein [Haloquadratum sp. J07HQX50]|nr:MAG: putative transposase DNA-binding domain protein [Haloquadratum sp. J07HQX50]
MISSPRYRLDVRRGRGDGVGDLTDMLETHWSVRVNKKTHNFWVFKKFSHRLACVCEEYGISLEAESETWTSQTCPECCDHEEAVRHRNMLTVWLRGSRRPHGVRDVPSRTQPDGTQADGTAHAIRVGRPRLTLS